MRAAFPLTVPWCQYIQYQGPDVLNKECSNHYCYYKLHMKLENKLNNIVDHLMIVQELFIIYYEYLC